MNNLLFTSEKDSNAGDKLLKELIELLDCPIGGYMVKISKEPDNPNVRIFDLTSLYDGEEGNIFFKKDDLACVSKLNRDLFETIGVEMLEKSLKNRSIIIMNKIGFVETKAEKFIGEVIKIFDSPKPVLGIMKNRQCDYINNIKSRNDVIIMDVDSNNYDTVKNKSLEILKSWNVKLK
jgi:nucleoside-triphosphatase